MKDALVLQALSDALWVEIRTKAPTAKSYFAPSDNEFSKFVKGHSNEYGSLQAWLRFQEVIFDFTTRKKFIVVTDIANYYDSISYDHLRNIIADLSLAREHALDLLIYTLSFMIWQPDHMPRVAVGLPQINLDAPRLLAHCFLFEIDRVLSLIAADFARYMDDIDIGVNSVSAARGILRDLDLALQTRQVRLNSGKTKILLEDEARAHFKVTENILLNRLSDRIEAKRSAGTSLTIESNSVRRAIEKGFRIHAFSVGNGEKILKRLLNFARQTQTEISDQHFEEILLNWPGLREAALLWWQHSAVPDAKLHLITKMVQDNTFVDDAAPMAISISLVNARLSNGGYVRSQISLILAAMDSTTPWGFYAKAWMLSKYGFDLEVLDLIEQNASMWVTQEHLSRLAAGLLPRLLRTKHRSKFEAIIRQSGSAWCLPVLQFHADLSTGLNGYKAVGKFILAPNSSLPNRISHAKFLMLIALISNPDMSSTVIAKLKSTHDHALNDPFYRDLIP